MFCQTDWDDLFGRKIICDRGFESRERNISIASWFIFLTRQIPYFKNDSINTIVSLFCSFQSTKKKTAKHLPWKSSENIGRPTIKQNPPKNYNKCRLHEQISTIITTFDQNWPVCSSINIIGLRTFREARILKNSSKYRLMFQQSIPRLFPDSDIATYHWPFILIDEQTGQFWSKVVINLIQNRNWKFENCDWFFLINQKVRILNQRRKFINSNLAEISYCSIQIA